MSCRLSRHRFVGELYQANTRTDERREDITVHCRLGSTTVSITPPSKSHTNQEFRCESEDSEKTPSSRMMSLWGLKIERRTELISCSRGRYNWRQSIRHDSPSVSEEPQSTAAVIGRAIRRVERRFSGGGRVNRRKF